MNRKWLNQQREKRNKKTLTRLHLECYTCYKYNNHTMPNNINKKIFPKPIKRIRGQVGDWWRTKIAKPYKNQAKKTERSTLCDQRKLIVWIFSAFQFCFRSFVSVSLAFGPRVKNGWCSLRSVSMFVLDRHRLKFELNVKLQIQMCWRR